MQKESMVKRCENYKFLW